MWFMKLKIFSDILSKQPNTSWVDICWIGDNKKHNLGEYIFANEPFLCIWNQNTSQDKTPAADPTHTASITDELQWFAVSLMTTWSQSHTTNMQPGSAAQEPALHYSSTLSHHFVWDPGSSVPLKCTLLKLRSGTISQSLILLHPECPTVSQLVSHGH